MSTDASIAALIPVKGFNRAKHRLASLLSAAERSALAEAMLRDTLEQTLCARGLAATFVVTPDPQVAALAAACGAEILTEEAERGETEAVHFARARLQQLGFCANLVVPADIPLIQSTDIEQVLAYRLAPPDALLVPSHDRLGTNALLLAPPDVITLRFGYDSFNYHLRTVAARGLPQRILENARIGLDIDEPADLERFLGIATGGHTYRLLLGMNTGARLAEWHG